MSRLVTCYTPEYNIRKFGENAVKPETIEADAQEEKPLRVETVEFYAQQNSIKHHTDKYELVNNHPANPVFRRGQAFSFAIRSERNFDSAKDLLKLTFSFGPRPVVTLGTKVELNVGDNPELVQGKAKWDVILLSNQNKVISLKINIPATVCVGLWKCEVSSSLKGKVDKPETFSCKESIYIIFNPWCKKDAVYLSNEEQRDEYVLSDVGKVYVGIANRPRGRRWIYAQFDDIVLPCCDFILKLSKLNFASRRNVVKVVRAISAAVNHLDDNGVLVGRWAGKYEDGVAPWDWTGSLKIIEKYMASGGKPVKYGQCWVFSGVTTTICRALGIPCRSVTNFVSAHDTDETLTVDKYFDKKGNFIDNKTKDSIWNYHVWNDVWMTRRDLPNGYGGWQAIDATPQEKSGNVYQAGPASLVAILRGEIGFQYDTQFLFSEVNAEVIHWHEDSENQFGYQKMKDHNYRVGQKIYTKKVGVFDDLGDSDAVDIIAQYKSHERSDEERLAMLKAARAAGLEDIYDVPENKVNHDVFFDLEEIEKITIGDPFNIKVQIENQSNEPRTINAILSTSSVYYTGVQAQKIKKVVQSFTLEPKQQETLVINVKDDDYLDKLVDYSLVKIYAMAFVKETKQAWTEEDDFAVETPKLELEVSGTVKLGQEFEMVATFTNPLKRALHEGHFTFEGTGIARPRTVKIRTVQPGETFRHVEKFQPTRVGEKKIVANFSSNILKELTSSKTLNVES